MHEEQRLHRDQTSVVIRLIQPLPVTMQGTTANTKRL